MKRFFRPGKRTEIGTGNTAGSGTGPTATGIKPAESTSLDPRLIGFDLNGNGLEGHDPVGLLNGEKAVTAPEHSPDYIAKRVAYLCTMPYEDLVQIAELATNLFSMTSDTASKAYQARLDAAVRQLRKEIRNGVPVVQIRALRLWTSLADMAEDTQVAIISQRAHSFNYDTPRPGEPGWQSTPFAIATSGKKFLDSLSDVFLNPKSDPSVRQILLHALSAQAFTNQHDAKGSQLTYAYNRIKPIDAPINGERSQRHRSSATNGTKSTANGQASPNPVESWVREQRDQLQAEAHQLRRRRTLEGGSAPHKTKQKAREQEDPNWAAHAYDLDIHVETEVALNNARVLMQSLAYNDPKDIESNEIVLEFRDKCGRSIEFISGMVDQYSARVEQEGSAGTGGQDDPANILARLLQVHGELSDAFELYEKMVLQAREERENHEVTERSKSDTRRRYDDYPECDDSQPFESASTSGHMAPSRIYDTLPALDGPAAGVQASDMAHQVIGGDGFAPRTERLGQAPRHGKGRAYSRDQIESFVPQTTESSLRPDPSDGLTAHTQAMHLSEVPTQETAGWTTDPVESEQAGYDPYARSPTLEANLSASHDEMPPELELDDPHDAKPNVNAHASLLNGLPAMEPDTQSYEAYAEPPPPLPAVPSPAQCRGSSTPY